MLSMRWAVVVVGLWLAFMAGYDKGVHDSLCKVAQAQQLNCPPGKTCTGFGPVLSEPKACAPWQLWQP